MGVEVGAGSASGCTSAAAARATPRSLPYFSVGDMEAALERVREHGGSVIHPGERWSICRDSEGSPFALSAD